MSYQLDTIPVVKYCIGDENEGFNEADDPKDFDASIALLEKLRADDPMTNYTLFAEVDA